MMHQAASFVGSCVQWLAAIQNSLATKLITSSAAFYSSEPCCNRLPIVATTHAKRRIAKFACKLGSRSHIVPLAARRRKHDLCAGVCARAWVCVCSLVFAPSATQQFISARHAASSNFLGGLFQKQNRNSVIVFTCFTFSKLFVCLSPRGSADAQRSIYCRTQACAPKHSLGRASTLLHHSRPFEWVANSHRSNLLTPSKRK